MTSAVRKTKIAFLQATATASFTNRAQGGELRISATTCLR
jgi:hypothetical protein